MNRFSQSDEGRRNTQNFKSHFLQKNNIKSVKHE